MIFSNQMKRINSTMQMGFTAVVASINRVGDRICEKLDAIHDILNNPLLTESRELYRRAAKNYQNKFFEEALEDIKEAVEKNKTDYISWFLEGQIYLFGAGEFSNVVDPVMAEEALKTAAKYVSADMDTSEEAKYLAAEIYYYLGFARYILSGISKGNGNLESYQEFLETSEQASKKSYFCSDKMLDALYAAARVQSLMEKKQDVLTNLEKCLRQDYFYAIKLSGDNNFENMAEDVSVLITKLRDEYAVEAKKLQQELKTLSEDFLFLGGGFSDKVKALVDECLGTEDIESLPYVDVRALIDNCDACIQTLKEEDFPFDRLVCDKEFKKPEWLRTEGLKSSSIDYYLLGEVHTGKIWPENAKTLSAKVLKQTVENNVKNIFSKIHSEFCSDTIVPTYIDYKHLNLWSNFFIVFSFKYDFLSNENFNLKFHVLQGKGVFLFSSLSNLELIENKKDSNSPTTSPKIVIDSCGTGEIAIVKLICKYLNLRFGEAAQLLKSTPAVLPHTESLTEYKAKDFIADITEAGGKAHTTSVSERMYMYEASHIPYNFSMNSNSMYNSAYKLDDYTVIFDSSFPDNRIKIYQKGIVNKKKLNTEKKAIDINERHIDGRSLMARGISCFNREELEYYFRNNRQEVINALKSFPIDETQHVILKGLRNVAAFSNDFPLYVNEFCKDDSEIMEQLRTFWNSRFDFLCTKEGKSGCYVATCVYGSYDCPEVWTLRRFRDDTLGSTWYGRLFIKTYYAISPTLVKWFGETKWFKNMWQPTLDNMVRKLQSRGVENTPYKDKMW